MILTGVFTGYGISELAEDTPEYDIKPTPVEVTQNRTIQNITSKNIYNEYEYDYTNFQAPHLENLEYSVEDGQLTVDNVDFCGAIYGSSMQVGIWDDNTVCFREYTGQDLKQGQIIRYEVNETYAVHSIVGDYEKLGYVDTQGYNTVQRERVEIERIRHVSIGILYT